jgi:hypothetical protein
MIKRVLAAILVAGSVWGFPVTTNEVAVDVDDSRTFSFRIAQGETQDFKLTYEKSGVELSVAGLTADFLYQAQGWTNWAIIDGTAASNYVVFPWGPDYDSGESRYKGWVRLRDSNGNPAYRTGMDFAMIRTPGFQPNPVAMNTNSILDWATYHGYEHTATVGPVRPDFVTIGAVTNADGSIVISSIAEAESDPVFTNWVASANTSEWDEAYSWGDHGTNGYLTSESDTLQSVTDRGATTTNVITASGLVLATNTPASPASGQLWFDGESFNAKTASDVTLQLGEETVGMFRALVPIANGQAVYMVGEQGDRITVGLATTSLALSSRAFLGLATEDIASGQLGRVTVFGLVRGLSTTAIPFPAGSDLYLNHVAGAVTTNASDVYVGKVGRVYGSNVDVFVMPYYDATTFDYTAITNVPWVATNDTRHLASLTNAAEFATAAQGLLADSAVQPAALSGYVPTSATNAFVRTNDTRTVSLTGNLSAANLTASGAITGATARLTATTGTILDAGGWTGVPSGIDTHSNVKGDLFAGNDGANTGRLRFGSNINSAFISANEYYRGTAPLENRSMDTTKPSLTFNLRHGSDDRFTFTRAAATNGATVHTELVRIVGASGNLGIGITPTARLHVNGNVLITTNLTVSGSITGATVVATGDVSAANLTASGAITGATANFASGILRVNSSGVGINANPLADYPFYTVGNSLLSGYAFFMGVTNFWPVADTASIYGTAGTGSEFPFLAAGNLVLQARASSGRSIVFAAGSPTRAAAVFSSAGNLGLNITAPTEILHVNGSALITTNLTVSGSITAGSSVQGTYFAGTNYLCEADFPDDGTQTFDTSFTVVTNFEINVCHEGLYTATHSNVTVLASGTYRMDTVLSFASASACELAMHLYTNGAAYVTPGGNNVGWNRSVGVNSDGTVMASKTIMLNANDVVDWRIQSDGTDTITWKHGTVRIERK